MTPLPRSVRPGGSGEGNNRLELDSDGGGGRDLVGVAGAGEVTGGNVLRQLILDPGDAGLVGVTEGWTSVCRRSSEANADPPRAPGLRLRGIGLRARPRRAADGVPGEPGLALERRGSWDRESFSGRGSGEGEGEVGFDVDVVAGVSNGSDRRRDGV